MNPGYFWLLMSQEDHERAEKNSNNFVPNRV